MALKTRPGPVLDWRIGSKFDPQRHMKWVRVHSGGKTGRFGRLPHESAFDPHCHSAAACICFSRMSGRDCGWNPEQYCLYQNSLAGPFPRRDRWLLSGLMASPRPRSDCSGGVGCDLSYRTQCFLKIVLQKPIPTQIRQLILFISNSKG